MLFDLLNITCSYLTLEEILTFTKCNIKLRDKIISKNFIILPNINFAIENGHLETIKYLFEHRCLDMRKYVSESWIQPTYNGINLASRNGHFEVIKYLFEIGIQPTYYAIEWGSENGHLEIIEYLLKKGIKATYNAIILAGKNGHLEIVDLLRSKGY